MAGTISFTGLASGMDTASWVEALVNIKKEAVTKLETKQTVAETKRKSLTTVQSTFTTLRSSLEKITDAKFGSTFDLFAKSKASSSNDSVVTATATSAASKQNINVEVEQLASSTVVRGSSSGSFINGNENFTSVANGEARTGEFNMYVDGQRHTINIENEDTVNDVLQKITDQTGLQAGVVDGKISISNKDIGEVEHELTVGSKLDTSNFTEVMGLYAKEDGSYGSYNKISKINLSGKLLDGSAGFTDAITESTFKIGDQEFNVDSNTTINSLISKINSNEKANVTASWDASLGNLVLKSNSDGAFNVNIENVSGNFTDVMGLTESTYGESGEVISSKLKSGTQTLGDFAKLTVNGVSMISSSNTVTSDITGLSGVTLNLKAVSTEKDGTTNISVAQNTDDLLSAVKGFVEKFNTTLSQVDTATGADGDLYGESTLRSIRNTLRSSVTSSDSNVSDDKYKLLASIGITTGAIGTGIDQETDKLVLDESKFLAALEDNPTAVKELLVGTSSGGTSTGGILNKLETVVENATNSTTGYFSQKSKSYDKEIATLKDKVKTQNTRVSDYKARLENQFNNMEKIIASMNKAYSSFTTG